MRFGGFRPGLDVIQIDPPQAYGIGQYAKTLDMLAGHGWPRSGMFPHGGNQMSLAIAAGFGLGGAESYPGVFGDFGGFADDARIEAGMISLSRSPRHRLRGQQRLFRIYARPRGHLTRPKPCGFGAFCRPAAVKGL